MFKLLVAASLPVILVVTALSFCLAIAAPMVNCDRLVTPTAPNAPIIALCTPDNPPTMLVILLPILPSLDLNVSILLLAVVNAVPKLIPSLLAPLAIRFITCPSIVTLPVVVVTCPLRVASPAGLILNPTSVLVLLLNDCILLFKVSVILVHFCLIFSAALRNG